MAIFLALLVFRSIDLFTVQLLTTRIRKSSTVHNGMYCMIIPISKKNNIHLYVKIYMCIGGD